ncbi:MAG: pyruvate kinase [Opitutae bacterium]|nr:pyruvate kinase [Opitutae bacterium]|tara:strand:- start:4992 stop:6419 length:1428 start_codon:yes stop_codon:yes gene_type:complete
MSLPFRQTKIIVTLGPATESSETLMDLLNHGVDVFRLNMAHAGHKWTKQIIERIRVACDQTGRQAAVMMDVKGPEIRTGFLKHPLTLEKGDLIDLVHRREQGIATTKGVRVVDVNYPKLAKHVKDDQIIMVDNGLIQMQVLERSKKRVRCEVTSPGELESRRHVNLPGVKVDLPSITDKDRSDVRVGVEMNVDLFALSFARDAKVVESFRELLVKEGSDAEVIAKVEDQHAVENLSEIIEAADALMVARGDLGIECPFEELPIIQRRAVKETISAGKPVIVATHLLESMIEMPVPTRAEVSDVAGAVSEQVDALMLSGETTTGKHPIECVRVLERIARRAEAELKPALTDELMLLQPRLKLLRSASALAMQMEDSAIVVFTRTGNLAMKLSSLRPNRVPIHVFTDNPRLQPKLQMRWGLDPFVMEFSEDPEVTLGQAIKHLKEIGRVAAGDCLVAVTNALAIDKVVETIQLREVE